MLLNICEKVFECQNFSCLLNATFNLVFKCENSIKYIRMEKCVKFFLFWYVWNVCEGNTKKFHKENILLDFRWIELKNPESQRKKNFFIQGKSLKRSKIWQTALKKNLLSLRKLKSWKLKLKFYSRMLPATYVLWFLTSAQIVETSSSPSLKFHP